MKRITSLKVVEGAAWAAGSALLIVYAIAEWHFTRSHQSGLEAFADARRQVSQLPLGSGGTPDASAHDEIRLAVDVASSEADMPGLRIESDGLPSVAAPDMTSWSAGRIAAYRAEQPSHAPDAVLRIRSIDLDVPVYAGVTETNLNRGAAWIDGTAALLGAAGNIGLAAHRDGYFRALRGIGMGDRIELQTLQRTQVYAVDEIRIVEPEEVQVLAPTEERRITLITCYPFYMVGPAPKRFIVRARAANARDPS